MGEHVLRNEISIVDIEEYKSQQTPKVSSPQSNDCHFIPQVVDEMMKSLI